jgi:hypothetical protein
MAQRRQRFWFGLALLAGALSSGCQPQVQQQARIPVPEAPPCSNQNLSTEALFSGAKRGVAVVTTDSGAGSAFVVRHQVGITPAPKSTASSATTTLMAMPVGCREI